MPLSLALLLTLLSLLLTNVGHCVPVADPSGVFANIVVAASADRHGSVSVSALAPASSIKVLQHVIRGGTQGFLLGGERNDRAPSLVVSPTVAVSFFIAWCM